MQALRLLMLVLVLVLAYLLVLRPTTKTEDLPPNLVESAVPGATPAGARPGGPPRAAHSQYKEAMDRAHAAVRQMQDQHADADLN